MTETPKHRATAQSVWARFWRWLTTVEVRDEHETTKARHPLDASDAPSD